jgi:two-component system cell cycle response regulator
LNSEFSNSRGRGAPLALLLFDIDHFKGLNDNHGHQAGDAVLREVVQAVQRALRAEDVLARYGGEEFAVILKNVSSRSVHVMAERVRVAVEELEIDWQGAPIRTTVSVGGAYLARSTAVEEPAALIAAADQALYEAKHQGRNRVVLVTRGTE